MRVIRVTFLTGSLLLLVICAAVGSVRAQQLPDRVEFSRHIRPILSENCFQCHGPDQAAREAGMRLDAKFDKLVARRDGKTVIVPGAPDQSELYRRISHADVDERMPPESTERTLSPKQVALIRRWIGQGATFQKHWAFVPPKRPALPEVRDQSWPRNPVDYFVLARLEHEGIAYSPPARRETLIRRLSLDLTGLPPTREDVATFLADDSPAAYENVVDRLLASPRYGERMAMEWLDLARFADTDGYSEDGVRTMWPWRDWVINALNRNLAFDRFTIEQMAGDLLPAATLDQRIATGFHRNHRINREAGTIPEEWRIENVVDRVDTTATVWLGLTMACARCHTHKYDPISQREFYQFFAFFNSIDEVSKVRKGNAPPLLHVLSADQEVKIAELDRRISEARQEVENLQQAANQSEEAQKAAREKVNALSAERLAILKSAPTTMVMAELAEPRDTFVLERGQYDRPAAPVAPGVPAILPAIPANSSRNRLGLARWLVSPDHPLTARVTVNRYWQMYFGMGLVKTVEDFGAQGELPSHPELLDWLAVEFVESGWNVKALQRLIVTSATYRQSSKISRAAMKKDPHNRLLARATRMRLPAEIIRDQALATSGLLVGTIGGPSVKPHEPAGIWERVAFKVKYVPDQGASLYRRSLYTFWKRTVPPPSMSTLDAPNRETCKTRRSRTNTPLQALLLMNDRTYVESARVFAQRVLSEGGSSAGERLDFAFRQIFARRPTSEEHEVLRRALDRYLKIYRDDPGGAGQLVSVGDTARDNALDVAELAAYTALASVLLNLDKTITRE